MEHRKGNLFTSSQMALGHGVNCKGLMGAGIAKMFKENYPLNYREYQAACGVGDPRLGPTMLLPGRSLITMEDNRRIVNMATQYHPGRDARYTWLHLAARDAMLGLERLGIRSMAIPEIGCGIGGLRWDLVESILLELEDEFNGALHHGFEFEVWHY